MNSEPKRYKIVSLSAKLKTFGSLRLRSKMKLILSPFFYPDFGLIRATHGFAPHPGAGDHTIIINTLTHGRVDVGVQMHAVLDIMNLFACC